MKKMMVRVPRHCVLINRRMARAERNAFNVKPNARHERELHSEMVAESCQMIQNLKYAYVVLKYEWLSKLVIFYNM